METFEAIGADLQTGCAEINFQHAPAQTWLQIMSLEVQANYILIGPEVLIVSVTFRFFFFPFILHSQADTLEIQSRL